MISLRNPYTSSGPSKAAIIITNFSLSSCLCFPSKYIPTSALNNKITKPTLTIRLAGWEYRGLVSGILAPIGNETFKYTVFLLNPTHPNIMTMMINAAPAVIDVTVSWSPNHIL